MKKPFKDTKAYAILKGLLRGTIDEVPVIGSALSNYLENTPENPTGKVNWSRIIGQIATIGLILLYVTQKLTEEQLNMLFDLLSSITG